MTLRDEYAKCQNCKQSGAMLLVGVPGPEDGYHTGHYEYECQYCGEDRVYTVAEMNEIRESVKEEGAE